MRSAALVEFVTTRASFGSAPRADLYPLGAFTNKTVKFSRMNNFWAIDLPGIIVLLYRQHNRLSGGAHTNTAEPPCSPNFLPIAIFEKQAAVARGYYFFAGT